MKKLLGAFNSPSPRAAFRPAGAEAAPAFPDDSFQTVTDVASALLLGLSVLVLVDWITPFFTFIRPVWNMWVSAADVAACFALLGAVFLYYNRHPFSLSGRALMMSAGVGVAAWSALHPLFFAWDAWVPIPLPRTMERIETFLNEGSPFTTGMLFFQAVSLAFLPALLRRHRRYGDWVGAGNLLIIIVNTLFLLNFLYGSPADWGTGFSTPGFTGACSTSLLGMALLSRMGPGYFPSRPFVGPATDAVLLRKIMPVMITAVLISSLVGNTLPPSLDKTLSSYLALLIAALIMIGVVLRASHVIGRNLEEAQNESETLYAGLVGSLEDTGVVLLNSQARVILWNRGAERVTGYAAQEVAGERAMSLFPADGINVEAVLREAATKGVSHHQGWTERKGGASFWAETRVSAIPGRDGVLAGYSLVLQDLTGEKRADDEIKASLKEKEVMLKEIHHRVKNNLQVISSLLRMQSDKAGDKAAQDLFADSQHRVRAMAMVHEHLYQSPDLAHIDFANYVSQLVQSLVRAYGNPSAPLRPAVQVENVTLSLDTAIPCGLMLTELVSNALKYAYPKGAEGPVFVGFRLLPDAEYELMVADQGAGLPEGVDWQGSDGTLGLRLVQLLVKQLGGEIRLDRSGGTKFIITFKEYRPDAAKLGRRTV